MKEDIDAREIQEALESIREIKKALKNNLQILQPFLYEKRFVNLCLVTAAASAVLFGLLYAAVHVYGNLQVLPVFIKVALILFSVTVFVWACWYKWRILFTYGKDKNPNFSVQDLFLIPELYRLGLSSLFLFGAMTVFGIILCTQQGSWNMLLPLSFLYYAFLCLHYGLSLNLTMYRILGCVACMLMIVTALFMKQNPLLWSGGSITAFFLCFALAVHIAGRRS